MFWPSTRVPVGEILLKPDSGQWKNVRKKGNRPMCLMFWRIYNIPDKNSDWGQNVVLVRKFVQKSEDFKNEYHGLYMYHG